ncbi:MAG: SCO family protein [Thiolinea sp.]
MKLPLNNWLLAILLFCLFIVRAQVQAAEETIGGDFSLTDHYGNTYQLAEQRGKAVVMFFGFTHCPSICPDSLVKMASVVKKLEERANQVSVVFITVDPERDTVEKLAQYVPFFGKQLLGLTGSKSRIDSVTKAYRARYELIKKSPGDPYYNVDHSADIYVLDRMGKVDTIVPYGMPASHILQVVEGALNKPTGVLADEDSKKAREIASAKLPTTGSLDAPTTDSISVDSAASEHKLALPDLSGRQHQMTDYLGKTLVINFWATWCPPCRAELPALNRTWQALKDDDIAMLAVNVGEEKTAVTAFLRDFPIDFPVLLDEKGESMKRWKIKGMPTTVMLNPEGKLVYHVTGEREWDDPEILAQIRALKDTAD